MICLPFSPPKVVRASRLVTISPPYDHSVMVPTPVQLLLNTEWHQNPFPLGRILEPPISSASCDVSLVVDQTETKEGDSLVNGWVRLRTEKEMSPHSSTLAWKIPWTEEPGRLSSMGSLRVGHDWATSLSLFIFIHWRRKWQPTPVFLPGEFQGWGSLVGCRLWGCTELDTTEVT